MTRMEPTDRPDANEVGAASAERPTPQSETAASDDLGPGALPVLLIVLVAAVNGLLWLGVMMDDAYISFRYALNLGQGRGLVYNPGEHVEGYTNFLWTLTAAGAEALGVSAVWVMPWVGFVCLLALVAIVTSRAAEGLDRRTGILAATAAGIPLALHPGLGFYGVTGLESVAFALFVFLAVSAGTRARPERFAVWTTVAFLTRPEAALIGVAGAVWYFVRGIRTRDWSPFVRTTSIFVALIGPYLLFKFWWFGSILPNTLAAKPPDPFIGVYYVLRTGGEWLVAAIAVVAVATARRDSVARVLGLTGLLGLLVVMLEGGDWMPLDRFLVPWLGCIALGLGLSVAGNVGKTRGVLLMVSLALAVAGIARGAAYRPTIGNVTGLDQTRASVARDLVDIGVESVGCVDIGIIGYSQPSLYILDLAGLVNPEIAAFPGDHLSRQPSVEYLEANAPDAFLLITSAPPNLENGVDVDFIFDVERYLFHLPWFRENYGLLSTTPGAAGYYINITVRRDFAEIRAERARSER